MASSRRIAQLHFEVLRQAQDDNDEQFVPNSTLQKIVLEWLSQNFAGFHMDDYVDIPTNGTLPYARMIQSIHVVDYSGPRQRAEFLSFDEMDPIVHVYDLHDTEPIDNGHGSRKGQHSERRLPNKALEGSWEGLVFDTIDPAQILRSISRIIILLKQPAVDLNTLNFNRIVLFHGPPGCGKTTLCRALAQKLSIRLSAHFALTRLYEINTQSLLSKFYSESGRLISELFDKILRQSRNASTLICVLIDEVESIAGNREKLSESGECHDSIRATNQLLTALDRVRDQPNVMVFCTSNLKAAIDVAFLDRMDYEVAVPPPCEAAIYQILRSTINELIRCGLVTSDVSNMPNEVLHGENDRMNIPPWNIIITLKDSPRCPGKVVETIVKKCQGFSGRKLRKLPLLAITTHTWGDSCSLDEALMALEKAVDSDLEQRNGIVIDTDLDESNGLVLVTDRDEGNDIVIDTDPDKRNGNGIVLDTAGDEGNDIIVDTDPDKSNGNGIVPNTAGDEGNGIVNK